MLEFTGKYLITDSAIGYNGVIAPSEIMNEIRKMENQRFIITINNAISYPGTPVPIDKGSYLVLINKARAKKLKLQVGDQVQVSFAHDESEYGMPMPEEMAMVLSEDPEGEAFLKGLTPGKIRSLIYLVSKVKNPDKRIEKAVVILEHLRANKGKLDMKMLNVAFKEYGKR